MTLIDVKVPDIGDFKDVAVIELLVKPGDTIKAEQSLVTVESDKASMEIPSSHAGVVKELKVKLGDKVSEGSGLLTLESDAAAVSSSSPPPPGEGRVGAG
ncbi:MAG: aceF, partial [Ramlibacter sp.]|nr:aceF [Ramlibacter sp.]